MFVGASNRRPSWFWLARYRALIVPCRSELGSPSPGFLSAGFLSSGTLGVRFAQLQTQDPYIRRSFDPDTDLVTADANDGQDDIVTQVNPFGFFSCQNQHDLSDSFCFRTLVVASLVLGPSLGCRNQVLDTSHPGALSGRVIEQDACRSEIEDRRQSHAPWTMQTIKNTTRTSLPYQTLLGHWKGVRKQLMHPAELFQNQISNTAQIWQFLIPCCCELTRLIRQALLSASSVKNLARTQISTGQFSLSCRQALHS